MEKLGSWILPSDAKEAELKRQLEENKRLEPRMTAAEERSEFSRPLKTQLAIWNDEDEAAAIAREELERCE